jgi:hypothetical protein
LEDLVSPIIVIEQKCPKNNRPWYTLSINKEGTVEYNGIKGVKILGRKYSHIKRELVSELVNHAITIYFFSLRDQYDDPLKYPDLCQTSISITPGVRYKKITYLENSRVPRSLVALVKKIEQITNVAQWTENT